ncbi:hypothetical protein M3Y98_00951000 [Aphelenchoides besseyi]|nr:hypothetical protein M3Y98_00951000 [Aphelenchoides besseyi]KAI6194567.1 hypothetical protein M3Y96_01138600 [Aphelenchoides besseyi]
MAAYGAFVENSGTLSRSERNLVSQLRSKGLVAMCKTYGMDDRFLIFYEFDQRTNWMFDTFNGIQKEIHVNSRSINERGINSSLGLELLFFIDSSTVCGIVHTNPGNGRYWFNGKFDVDFVLHIDTVKYLGELDYTLDTRAQPTTLNAHSIHHLYSHTVDLTTGVLSEVNVTNIPHDLWSPMTRDGKLFGFAIDEKAIVNTKMLYEVSLIDGTKIEHEVKEEMDVLYYVLQVPSLWINNQLLAPLFDRNNYISTILKFDILQMKWEKTDIELEGRIRLMTVANGLLIVHVLTCKDKSDPIGPFFLREEFNQIYRFQYEAVDSLSNLAWLSMQRHSTRYPSFRDFFLSQIPKNYRLRPLWNNRKRKHE